MSYASHRNLWWAIRIFLTATKDKTYYTFEKGLYNVFFFCLFFFFFLLQYI